MAHSFKFDNKCLYWEFSGFIDDEDLIVANSELVGYPEFEKISYIIWDGSNIEGSNVDETSAKLSASFAAAVNKHNPDLKVAFVAHDPHLCALINHYINLTLALVPHAQQKLFSSIAEAEAWANSNCE